MTDANQNYPISTVRIPVWDFEVYIPKQINGQIYIGGSDLDATWIPRAAGSSYNYVAGNGNMTGYSAPLGFDFSKWYVRSTAAGDTVIVEYLAFGDV